MPCTCHVGMRMFEYTNITLSSLLMADYTTAIRVFVDCTCDSAFGKHNTIPRTRLLVPLPTCTSMVFKGVMKAPVQECILCFSRSCSSNDARKGQVTSSQREQVVSYYT